MMRKPARRSKARKSSSSGSAVATGAAVTLGALAGGAAAAATFTVTNVGDAGAGSLRQAIADANGAAGADIVDFQAGLVGTITLTTGQLAITDSVDIQGPGPFSITVSGNDSSRVFYLNSSSATIDVTISGLTITGGNASDGGGIFDLDENLLLDNVIVDDNAATLDGGGLWADGFNMNLTIRDSIFSGNTAGGDGGAIYVEDTGGPLLIQRTSITGNDAVGHGGGVYFYDPDDDVTIEDSTISGNSAGNDGGGVYLYSPDAGLFTIRGTTVSGNDADDGGGVFLYSPDHGGTIENSTISGNQATAGDGGGIYLYNLYNLYNFDLNHVTVAGNSASNAGGGAFLSNDIPQILPITNSILADNTASTNNDLTGGDFDVSFSLVEDPGTASLNDLGGNLLNQDPQLGALAANGGPTQTHRPAATSPVLNAGNNGLTTDQRGFARPINTTVDMGAVELNPGTIQLLLTAASVAENAGTVTITATRTGGTDGAVSVTISSADISAIAPGDYTAIPGATTLNWANGDGTPKTLNVTIVNDPDDEPDETFSATISAPTGGAILGANQTEVVTITDDDVLTSVIEVPTLGEMGKILLAGVLGAAALLLLRRRRGAAPLVLAISLALAGEVEAAPKGATRTAGTLATVTIVGDSVTLVLSDGTQVNAPVAAVELKDHRRSPGRAAQPAAAAPPALATLGVGQPVLLKVKRDAAGNVKRVKIQLHETLARSQAEVKD
jgi:predicted outer membrane repeat protein